MWNINSPSRPHEPHSPYWCPDRASCSSHRKRASSQSALRIRVTPTDQPPAIFEFQWLFITKWLLFPAMLRGYSLQNKTTQCRHIPALMLYGLSAYTRDQIEREFSSSPVTSVCHQDTANASWDSSWSDRRASLPPHDAPHWGTKLDIIDRTYNKTISSNPIRVSIGSNPPKIILKSVTESEILP